MKKVLSVLLEIFNLVAIGRSFQKTRGLIITLTKRDFKARFRGSFGGVFWSFIQPLIMMVIYTLVFSTFLKVRFQNSDSPYTFAVFLLCGLLPWTAFSEGFSTSTVLIRGNANLVKRVVFPLEVLPFVQTLVSVIQQCIGFLILLPLAWIINHNLSWNLFYVPIILFFQILLFTGINWFWTSLSVFIPDLKQVTQLLLSLLMFLTPIFYPKETIPQWAMPLFNINPLSMVIDLYRRAFLTGEVITSGEIISTGLVSMIIFLLGRYWFIHTKKGFADIL